MDLRMQSPFHVEIVPSLAEMAPRWARLQQQCPGTPFQQVHWLGNWYGVFGGRPGIEPILIAVSERESGRDVMLIPLIRRRSGATSTIEFADLWVTDCNAPLV